MSFLSLFVHPSLGNQYDVVLTEYTSDGVNELCICKMKKGIMPDSCKSLYFAVVNGAIAGIDKAVMYANKTGETRYDFFTLSLSECKAAIKSRIDYYESYLAFLGSASEKAKWTYSKHLAAKVARLEKDGMLY